MNAGEGKRGEGTPPTFSEEGAAHAEAGPYLGRKECRQVIWITAGAVAVFLFMRFLPTGTNLNHMDFRVTGNEIDFCDPLNPQFIPVVDVRSPVAMRLSVAAAVKSGEQVRSGLTLTTASGKLIGPDDLLEVHTRKLHLLVVDPSLEDYQHVHPEPGGKAGEWEFSFTPVKSGMYRVFADFTPVATARGLYASADLTVGGEAGDGTESRGVKPLPHGAETLPQRVEPLSQRIVEREGYRFSLEVGNAEVRAGRSVDLKFAIVRSDGAPVPLEPVMGAFAHLVAFDEGRRGFAHLHPMEADLLARPETTRPVLSFKIMIPRAGRYVIWAQVNLAGSETFVPFWFDVVE